MTSLPRFFDPAPRYFTNNIQGLPGAKLYFTAAGSSTPKTTYQNKAGTIAHAYPVVANANGIFPPIFLDGIYKAELKNAAGVTQSGWPIDNVGQDETVVPFGPYSSTITYQTDEVVTDSAGDWYRSKIDNNTGNTPASSPTQWEVLVKPVPSNFVSDEAWATFVSGAGGTIQLNFDVDAMSLGLVASGLKTDLSLQNVDNTSDANKPVSTAQQAAFDLKLTGYQIKKTAATNRVSTTTLAADPDLTTASLATGHYAFKCVISWQGQGSTTNGIKAQVRTTTGTTLIQMALANANTTAANAAPTANDLVDSGAAFSKLPNYGGAKETLILDGFINVTSSGPIFLEWAQAASVATNTTVNSGYLIVNKI